MKVKHSFFLFFAGILIGTAIQSISQTTIVEAILSPIKNSFAYKEKIISPLPEDEETQTASLLNKKHERVLGEVTFIKASPSPCPSTSPMLSPSPSPAYSGAVSIAVFGDSMTDLMGTNLPYLKKELIKYYPQAELELLNYGVGAENIESGLQRISQPYTYKDRSYPSMVNKNPDIIILDPFVYNPFSKSEGEMDRHWIGMVNLVDKIKQQTTSKILILATISPNKDKFGTGPNGINWDKNTAWEHAQTIQKYIENSIEFSKAAEIELIDVYHKTLLDDKNGSLKYINSGDHIHQNIAGNKLIARETAKKISEVLH